MKNIMQIKRISPDARIPSRGSAKSAGYDLHAIEDVVIAGNSRALIKTGLQIAVPPGYYGRVAPRSGLALKHFIDVGAGVIDEDYRGELGVVLFNFSSDAFSITKGDRIAQLVIEQIGHPDIVEVDNFDTETQRGDGGFGSTGK